MRDLKSYNIKVEYIIKGSEDKKELNFVVNCPGMVFNCKFLEVSVDDCYTEDGILKAFLTIKGLLPSNSPLAQNQIRDPIKDMTYNLEADKPYESIDTKTGLIKESKYGAIPKNAQVTQTERDHYFLFADLGKDNFVKKLAVSFGPDLQFLCKDIFETKKQDISSGKECTLKEKEKQSIYPTTTIPTDTSPIQPISTTPTQLQVTQPLAKISNQIIIGILVFVIIALVIYHFIFRMKHKKKK